MGGKVLAQVQGPPDRGVTGIVIVNAGAVRVKGKVTGCHKVVRLVCNCVVALD